MTENEYIEYAKSWFLENQVEIPNTVKDWSKKSVRKKEIPPNMTYQCLLKNKISLVRILKEINSSNKTREVNYCPINEINSVEVLGLKIISEYIVNNHKKVEVKCCKCSRLETLDYGTLLRMRNSNNKYCRYCRNAGGKQKDLDRYDIFEGFKPLKIENKQVTFCCNNCNSSIKRSLAHCVNAEYLVCEICSPGIKTQIETDLGKFDSKMEFESYKILLNYFSKDEIIRQAKYSEIYNTNSKHTLDFYIPSIDLKLEVTTSHNKFSLTKYNNTKVWKESFGVIFAYTLKEVEDIVRSHMKV